MFLKQKFIQKMVNDMGFKYFHKIKSQTHGLAFYRLGTPLSKYFKTDLGSVLETFLSSILRAYDSLNIRRYFDL